MVKFNDWVTEMYLKFANEHMKGKCDVSHFSDNAITLCYDKKKNKVGIARKHPEDIYDYRTGVAIAYARCKGYKIPKQKVYKRLSEMKNGERFVGLSGDTFRYVAKDKNVFVVWSYEYKKYSAMPCDIEYEMVE